MGDNPQRDTAPSAGEGKQAMKSAAKLGSLLSLGMLTAALSGAPAAFAQTAPAPPPPPSARSSAAGAGSGSQKPAITPAEARELMRSVDSIMQFASADSQLPIRHKVKRRLISREEVTRYVVAKFNDDEDAKRMQRSEIVLKKFGLLDRDFQLRPFLTSLLTEQIAGYYDDKTKTVNLLDWIEPDAQRPVLAHELTHALQDQRVDLSKWGNKTDTNLARNVIEDNRHLAADEADSARDAVLEGQAMAVFVDYTLKASGRSLLTAPEMVEGLKDNMEDVSDSPVMARAPLLLQQSMLFPYREGLSFEAALLKDSGAAGAFAAALDRPPSTSYEILNPPAYERQEKIPLLTMPDIHDLLRTAYDPYDVGVMGALDVRMLTELFAGPDVSAQLTPQWDGGLYYAAQARSAQANGQRASTASLSLLYLSRWKTPEAADRFARIYAEELSKKYSRVSRDNASEADDSEQIYNTSEGPVLIAVSGRQVFVSESFDMPLARKLQLLLTGAQSSEGLQTASLAIGPAFAAGAAPSGTPRLRVSKMSPLPAPASDPLTGSMVRWLSSCGFMKAALPR